MAWSLGPVARLSLNTKVAEGGAFREAVMPPDQSEKAVPAEVVISILDDQGAQALVRAGGVEEDPFVAERLLGGTGGRDQVVTRFRPAPIRPLTYPAELPHLPGRPVWTTESQSGAVAPGARWQCDDPDALVEALSRASETMGWVRVPPPSLGPMPVRVAFRRGSLVRVLIEGAVPGGAIIQLLDMPGWPVAGE